MRNPSLIPSLFGDILKALARGRNRAPGPIAHGADPIAYQRSNIVLNRRKVIPQNIDRVLVARS